MLPEDAKDWQGLLPEFGLNHWQTFHRKLLLQKNFTPTPGIERVNRLRSFMYKFRIIEIKKILRVNI